MKPKKIHCLFEQTNTFRDVAKSLGYEAESYDIEGKPSHKVDLFKAIMEGGENEYLSKIKKEDLVLAFFPCTYFEVWSEINMIGKNKGMETWNDLKKIKYSAERERERSKNYQIFCSLVSWAIEKGVPMVIENPYQKCSYLIKYFPVLPKLVISDRTKYGDDFKKPTAFWFINCEPNLFVPELKKKKPKLIAETRYGIERSKISKEFAEIFLEEFVGIERLNIKGE